MPKRSSNGNVPNFLMVGAAKSGTTSLYHYLKQHPEVFMSLIKEPHFIVSQFIKSLGRGRGEDTLKVVRKYDEYLKLFEGSSGKKAVGEASNDNLYHYEEAIKYIKSFFGDPRIIIILRDPVDRAFSAYSYLMRDNREYLSFEEALEAEEKRMQEGWRCMWYYRDVGFYYNQVKAYKESFSRVKVALFDDLREDPKQLAKEIYEFLEVDPSFVPNTDTRHNVSGIPRCRWMNNLFLKKGLFQKTMRTTGTFILREEGWVRLRESVRSRILAETRMKKETRLKLRDIYRADIGKLQALIKRDLAHWMA